MVETGCCGGIKGRRCVNNTRKPSIRRCATPRTCSKGGSIRNPIGYSRSTTRARPGNPVLDGYPSRLNKTVRTGERLPCAPLRRILDRLKKAAEQARKATVAVDEPYLFSFGTNRVHLMHLNKVMYYQIFFDASILSCYVRVQRKTLVVNGNEDSVH